MRIKDWCHLINKTRVLSFFITILFFTSCQINELDVITQEPKPHDAVANVEEFATEIVPTQSMLATTLIQPTITPLPTATKLNTPTPIVTKTRTQPLSSPSLVKKVGELPIAGVVMAVSINGKFVATVNDDVSKISVYDLINSEIKWQLDMDSYPLRTTTLAV